MIIMAEKILEVRDLKTYFPGRNETVKSVDGVSFDVYKGETFGLVGESGCGKSQTCRSILGLLKKPGQVVGGQIILDGQDITHLKEKELRKLRGKKMSVIFQEPMTSLSPVLKIKHQLMEVFDGEPMTKAEKKKRAIELLRMVGIPSPEVRMDEYTFQFSGGMRQRAMIAMALGARPKLLIADEPTTALDVTIQDQIMKLINKLKQELDMSVILVTHDLGVIAQMCDRVAVMYSGLIHGNVRCGNAVCIAAASVHLCADVVSARSGQFGRTPERNSGFSAKPSAFAGGMSVLSALHGMCRNLQASTAGDT